MVNLGQRNSQNILTASLLVESGVTVDIKDMAGTLISSGNNADYNEVHKEFYWNAPATVFEKTQTYFIIWKYALDEKENILEDKIDIVEDLQPRYCYQSDVRRKLFDVLLPNTFDLSLYTLRATNEVDRALQGLYRLPLSPNPEHENYSQDIVSLAELTSDIAAGYAIEDISISSNTQQPNMKKAVAFAELNRYVDLKKVFASIPRTESKKDLHYQFNRPQVGNFNDGDRKTEDPFDLI